MVSSFGDVSLPLKNSSKPLWRTEGCSKRVGALNGLKRRDLYAEGNGVSERRSMTELSGAGRRNLCQASERLSVSFM